MVLKVLPRNLLSLAWLISMLWVSHVCDLLLDCDLEWECLPLLGRLTSLSTPALGGFSTILMALFHILFGSATRTKMVLNTTFMTLFTESWAFLVHMWCPAFIAGFGITLPSDITLTSLTIFICSGFIYCCHMGNSTIRLMPIKAFNGHFVFLGINWSRAVYVTSSHRFFERTHFFTSKCFVAWNSNSVWWTMASFNNIFIHWSNWSVVLLSPCLMLLYISSMWSQ